MAASHSLSLRLFARVGLGLQWHEITTDLDVVIGDNAQGLARVADIDVGMVQELRIAPRLRCSSWNPQTRRHNAQIFVCPDCMRGPTSHASLVWRSVLSFACVEHHRWLVGACDSCGEVIRCAVDVAGARFVPWLDIWPYCPHCGEAIGSGEPVPGWLLQSATAANAISERAPESDLTSALWLKLRMLARKCDGLVPALSRRLGLGWRVNALAVTTAILVRACDAQMHFHSGEDGGAMFRFLVGQSSNGSEIAEILGRLVEDITGESTI